jgi:hypothetical protein
MSFFILKYGADKEAIFNANCKVINLLQHIKEACSLQGEEVENLDLAEESTGAVQFLNVNLNEQANMLLTVPKGTYVALRVSSMSFCIY